MKKIFNLKLSNPQKAFTLIELLIVIAVLGILAAALITAINPVKRINQAKDSTIKSDIAQIANAMQTYLTARGTEGVAYYPSTIDALVAGLELKTEPKYQGNISYSIRKNPSTCTGTGTSPVCTDVAVYYALNDPKVKDNVWCWRSITAVADERTDADCKAGL